MSCSGNLYEGLVSEESDASLLEKAANQIDEQDYRGAEVTLAKVEGDSNQKRILQVASSLGTAGFDIWQIILDVLDTGSGGGDIGFDSLFDSVSSSIFGVEKKVERAEALRFSINTLLGAPDTSQSELKNLNCFLGGLLSFTVAEDGDSRISAVQSSLSSIQNNVVGSGSTAAECPGIEQLESNLSSLATIQEDLDLILRATSECSFIDTSSSSLNTVEERLQQFVSNGDKGCSDQPDCGDSLACQALQFGCVQSEVIDSNSEVNDGVVSSCEIVQNCLNATCF